MCYNLSIATVVLIQPYTAERVHMKTIVINNIIIAKTLRHGNIVDLVFINPPTFEQQIDILLDVIRQGCQIGDVVGI